MKEGVREFVVIHRRGSEFTRGRTATEALGRTFIPGGFRETLAIIETDLLGAARRPHGHTAPFFALVAPPHAPAGKSSIARPPKATSRAVKPGSTRS